MKKATLKVNSFKTQNTLLVNNNSVLLNSEFMNYYSKPIVSVVNKIFETLEAEFNDSFLLEIYGNKFEQALFKSVSSECELCEEISLKDTTVNYSFDERVELLGDIYSGITLECSLVTDLNDVSLPSFTGVTIVESDNKKIVVSDDLAFIHANISAKDDIAFFVDGESTKKGKTNIIGCSKDYVNLLLKDYISTVLLNPEFNKFSAEINDASNKKNVAFSTEPYFYCEKNISVDVNESVELPIKSYPADASLNDISYVCKGSSISIDGTTITGVNQGNDVIELYYESPISFASVSVEVIAYNNVKNINLDIDADSDVLCVGQKYELNIFMEPANAEDKDSLVINISNPEIADYQDGCLYIKKAGEFGVSANTAEANTLISFIVKDKISGIKLSEPPEKIYIGDVFEVTVETYPEDAFNSKYKWVSSDKSVAVVGVDKDGKELVKIVGVGTAEISCVSVDDETVSATMQIESDTTFNKSSQKQTFIFFGIFATIITFILGLAHAGVAYWISLVVTLGLLGYSIVKKETLKKAIFFIIISLISMIFYFMNY